MAEAPKILEVRPGICYGASGNLLLLYYRASPTVADLEARLPLFNETIRLHPEGCAFISVMDTGYDGSLPDAEARAETARQVEQRKDAIRAGAMVLIGDGMKTSLVRTLLRGLVFFRRGSVQLRFFATVDEAAPWCLSHLGEDGAQLRIRVREVLEAIEALSERAGYPPQPDES